MPTHHQTPARPPTCMAHTVSQIDIYLVVKATSQIYLVTQKGPCVDWWLYAPQLTRIRL